MTKDEFRRRFAEAVAQSARAASRVTKRTVPAPTSFVVHGAGHSKRILSFDEAADALYIAPDKSWRVVDVAVIVRAAEFGVGWVVASSHEPGSDDDTWDPGGIGPFKADGPVR